MVLPLVARPLAAFLALQTTGETALALPDPEPESWSVEYPLAIQPYVEEYHRCLNYGNRRLTGKADFEVQHASDLPRCEAIAKQAMASANAVLEKRGRSQQTPPEKVAEIFAAVGRIHIARGRDLDRQFTRRVEAYEGRHSEIEKMNHAPNS